MEKPPLTLIDVLQRRLERIDGAKALLITTLDGAELLSGQYFEQLPLTFTICHIVSA